MPVSRFKLAWLEYSYPPVSVPLMQLSFYNSRMESTCTIHSHTRFLAVPIPDVSLYHHHTSPNTPSGTLLVLVFVDCFFSTRHVVPAPCSLPLTFHTRMNGLIHAIACITARYRFPSHGEPLSDFDSPHGFSQYADMYRSVLRIRVHCSQTREQMRVMSMWSKW